MGKIKTKTYYSMIYIKSDYFIYILYYLIRKILNLYYCTVYSYSVQRYTVDQRVTVAEKPSLCGVVSKMSHFN